MRKVDGSNLAIAASVLLKNRNSQMSAIHHVIGQMLDHGGATDEVCSLLNLSVISPVLSYNLLH